MLTINRWFAFVVVVVTNKPTSSNEQKTSQPRPLARAAQLIFEIKKHY